jgi:hypothetical protein
MEEHRWTSVAMPSGSMTPFQPRFCHVAAVHHSTMYVFGGYDGVSRLNDFMSYNFGINYKRY